MNKPNLARGWYVVDRNNSDFIYRGPYQQAGTAAAVRAEMERNASNAKNQSWNLCIDFNGAEDKHCCADFVPQTAEIDSFIVGASVRAGINLFGGIPFRFCPWCGTPRPPETPEQEAARKAAHLKELKFIPIGDQSDLPELVKEYGIVTPMSTTKE